MNLRLTCILAVSVSLVLPLHGQTAGSEPSAPPAKKEADPATPKRDSAPPKKEASSTAKESKESKYGEKTFAGLELRQIGPAFTSGRIVDLAVDPRDARTWYIATASGGVWKTTNAGTTFNPIFDDQASYSTGCVTIDPHDSMVVWIGSGEDNSQRS